MPISPKIHAVFGYFQNLNLLALLNDLREGRVARQAWLSDSLLCPLAHGLGSGNQVRELRTMGQTADLDNGCHLASRLLGAHAFAVTRFVRLWDEGVVSNVWLTQQLEELWAERLTDAVAVQALIENAPTEQRMERTTIIDEQSEASWSGRNTSQTA